MKFQNKSVREFSLFKRIFFVILYAPLFLLDLILNLWSDHHTISFISYKYMRGLYTSTKGKSNKIISSLYKIRYKSKISYNPIRNQLLQSGYASIGSNAISIKLATEIKEKCKMLPVYENIKNIKSRKSFSSFQKTKDEGNYLCPRYLHYPKDIASIPEVWLLIDEMNLMNIASSYFNCDPIITTLYSWYVTPIIKSKSSEELYGFTAQSYHYDNEWLSFLKFFINLDDATELNGPFEFIPNSHNNRQPKYYKDERYMDLDKEAKPIYATGERGSIFVADTSGLHRDGRAISETRQVLSIEFAISSFGAKYQLDNTIMELAQSIDMNKLIPDRLFKNRSSKLYRR